MILRKIPMPSIYTKGPIVRPPSPPLLPTYGPASPGYPSPEEHRACRAEALRLLLRVRSAPESQMECAYGVLESANVPSDVTEFFQLLIEGTNSQINQVTQSALNDPGECPDLLLVLQMIVQAMDARECEKGSLLPWALGVGAAVVFGLFIWKRRRDQ